MAPAAAPPRSHRFGALAASLLIGVCWGPLAAGRPAGAAELLEMRLEGLEIPIHLDQLEAWNSQAGARIPSDNDLTPWLGLLDPVSRADLRRMLTAPLLRERSFGRQLLDTWAGGQLMGELGTLLTTTEGRSSTPMLQLTLRRLLEQHRDVSLLDVLKAMPERQLNLELDGLIGLAQRWRSQLVRQQRAFQALQSLPLPRTKGTGSPEDGPAIRAQLMRLAVVGRPEGLPLRIWTPAAGATDLPAKPWVLMMPGLGGNAHQLGWLAGAMARRGWPVVVVQHPGSDSQAMRAALVGQRPPPGAESLARRLADAEAVIAAQRQGRLPVQGQGVVLAGHSLGGLTALLAAGVPPTPGLKSRCRSALERLPISNPSRLLQCELSARAMPHTPPRPADLRAVVLFNGFGSLLWPDNGLAALPVPLLVVGGSLDLITPPLDEQLALFLPAVDRRSRLVVVDGGSHFSPVRMAERDDVLLRLGRELVGVDPLRVQGVLLSLTSGFLDSLEPAGSTGIAADPLPAQRRLQDGITAYVLDPAAARRWRAGL
ncbi:MAG: alpha/beta fold hydrolase [Cyanobium sp. ELA507]